VRVSYEWLQCSPLRARARIGDLASLSGSGTSSRRKPSEFCELTATRPSRRAASTACAEALDGAPEETGRMTSGVEWRSSSSVEQILPGRVNVERHIHASNAARASASMEAIKRVVDQGLSDIARARSLGSGVSKGTNC
jgi:hypothetical protein